MKLDINKVLMNILVFILLGCVILCLLNNNNKVITENFQDGADDELLRSLKADINNQSDSQLRNTISQLKERLIRYGYAPDMSKYIRKTELQPNMGKCTVDKSEDSDKYVLKSSIPPPGPRIDLSQYVKKSSIPPEKVCPPQKEIDYSAYVKKSSLPPNQECPPCIAPKVKVSAGLCKKCPPAPACPPPKRCPEPKCPEPKPCPDRPPCPAPKPCPTVKQTRCAEIKYIKVPTIITKVVKVDQTGKVLSKSVEKEETVISEEDEVPITTKQVMPEEEYNVPVPTKKRKQTDKTDGNCKLLSLNDDFRKYGVYGYDL
tara:strand:- start:584 stop:1531 length:948 start_codon:yes stop_codon:yes gene_type:complete